MTLKRLLFRLRREFPSRCVARPFSLSARQQILSKEFALADAWNQRFADFKAYKLGSGYEWIAAVQKKFIGDGRGSAVDVDAAACLASEADQTEDLVDLIYKLRHTENTADMLASTEYALYRHLLQHDDYTTLFKILEDPINYGVFMNEHCYCLAIDSFLNADNIIGAAIVATHVVKQEMFDDQLLNRLAIYSLLKWLTLSADERKLELPVEAAETTDESERIMEEEEFTFKFPWFRPEHNDGHFDVVVEPLRYAEKSLRWLANGLDAETLRDDVLNVAEALKTHTEAASLTSSGDGGETSDEAKAENDAEAVATETAEFKVDDAVLTRFHAALDEQLVGLEKTTSEKQRAKFDAWRERRRALIDAQARQLDLRLRIQELNAEETRIIEQIELLNFFKERVHWEDQAHEKDELYAEFELEKAEESETEEAYGKSMFERAARRHTNRKVQRSIL